MDDYCRVRIWKQRQLFDLRPEVSVPWRWQCSTCDTRNRIMHVLGHATFDGARRAVIDHIEHQC